MIVFLLPLLCCRRDNLSFSVLYVAAVNLWFFHRTECRLWGCPRFWWALDSYPYHQRGSDCAAWGNVPSLYPRRHQLPQGNSIKRFAFNLAFITITLAGSFLTFPSSTTCWNALGCDKSSYWNGNNTVKTIPLFVWTPTCALYRRCCSIRRPHLGFNSTAPKLEPTSWKSGYKWMFYPWGDSMCLAISWKSDTIMKLISCHCADDH